MAEALATLEKEYCPPIDSALFYAIASDFDLSDANALQSAKSALDQIKASAEAEETLTFDPSGSSNVEDAIDGVPQSPSQSRSWNGERATSSDDTDLTSVTTSARSLHLDDVGPFDGDPCPTPIDGAIDGLSVDGKLGILCTTFPALKPFDISHVLTRCGDDVEKAIDELLNQAYLQDGYDTEGERQHVPKGIDGFVQNNTHQSKKKGKGKKKKLPTALRRTSSMSAASAQTAISSPNKWSSGEDDIQFVVQRTGLQYKDVKSVYTKANYSLRTTIQNLGESSLKDGVADDAEDAVMQVYMADLSLDYPSIDSVHTKGIVKLTYPSTASAHDLAKAFISSTSSGRAARTVEGPVTPQYARPVIDEDDSIAPFTPVQRSHRQQVVAVDRSEASLRAQSFNAARSAAYAQATAAYRKSRSHPLMAAAAGYYASVGREAAASAQVYSYAAADALVSQQSTRTQIDLHGVDVKNAVEISIERVQKWWDSGHAEWAREGKVMGHGGFRIITGVGRHSQGGKAVLGPAVRKALVAEGWRIDEESGVLTVRGRARR